MIALNLWPNKVRLRDELWRRTVLRFAEHFVTRELELTADFKERACTFCDRPFLVNTRMFPDKDAFRCDTCSPWPIQRLGERDAYWFAICLNGADPEARYNAPLTATRRAELAEACEEVGLRFGSVKGRNANQRHVP